MSNKPENPDAKKKRRRRKSKRPENPGLFCEFGKIARGLLTKGYSDDKIFSISTKRIDKLILSSTVVKQHGRLTAGGLVAAYKYRDNKKAIIDVKLDAKLHALAAVTFSEKLSRTTKAVASLKLPDYKSSEISFFGKPLQSTEAVASLKFLDIISSKFNVQYFHQYAALAISAGLSEVEVSATVGSKRAALAIEASYKSFTSSFPSCNVGFTLREPKYITSVILANSGELLSLSYLHYFDDQKEIAAAAELTRKPENGCSFAVGGSWTSDYSTVKMRLNSYGKFSARLKHKIGEQADLKICTEFDIRALHETPRLGLSLALEI